MRAIIYPVGRSCVCPGGIPQTQEIVDYCAENKIYPRIQVIQAAAINDAWEKVLNKEARYRYVIDASTF